MVIFKKLRVFAELVGFSTIAMLAVYGGIALFNNAKSASAAADMTPHLAVKAAPILQTTSNTGIPPYINYQGTLRDRDGNPVRNGVYTMTLRIYDSLGQDAQPIFTSPDISVTVRNGNFSILLGDNPNDSPPLSTLKFNGPDRFIGITVDGHDEMSRQRFATVPYAFQAGHAYGLSAEDGEPYDAVFVDDLGNVGVGTTSPDRNLTIAGNSGAQTVYANVKSSTQEILMGVAPEFGGIISVMSDDDLVIRAGSNSEKMRISKNGNVGIGSGIPQAHLDVHGPNNQSVAIYSTDTGTDNSLASYTSVMAVTSNGVTESQIQYRRLLSLVAIDNGQSIMSLNADGSVIVPGSLSTGTATVGGNVTVGGEIRGKMQYTGVWNSADQDGYTQLIHSSKGFCFLTRVEGEWDRDDRWVGVLIGADGYWYLGDSAGSVHASAVCVGVNE